MYYIKSQFSKKNSLLFYFLHENPELKIHLNLPNNLNSLFSNKAWKSGHSGAKYIYD